ncbi:unnamed protein product, partial [Nesidiocoris tenuis]
CRNRFHLRSWNRDRRRRCRLWVGRFSLWRSNRPFEILSAAGCLLNIDQNRVKNLPFPAMDRYTRIVIFDIRRAKLDKIFFFQKLILQTILAKKFKKFQF